MKIIAGSSNLPLAQAIATYLNASLTQLSMKRFPDGEMFIEIREDIRGQDVFVIQSTSSPVNDTLIELLMILDTLKMKGARKIAAIIPYYGYGRQDRESTLGRSVSARLVATLLTAAGASHILSLDWHSTHIQGFFNIPATSLTLAPLFCEVIKARYGQEPVMIVSPDEGGLVRARLMAKHLGADMVIINKCRFDGKGVMTMNLTGEVAGRACILVDDIVDSAFTLCKAAELLTGAGAGSVEAFVTHGVLSDRAIENIHHSSLTCLNISNTILSAATTLPFIQNQDFVRGLPHWKSNSCYEAKFA